MISDTGNLSYDAKSGLLVKVHAFELVLQKTINLTGRIRVTDLSNNQIPIIVEPKQHRTTSTVKELPIKATHKAVVWGCVKMDKIVNKTFSIRNMSNSHLRLFASIESKRKTFKVF